MICESSDASVSPRSLIVSRILAEASAVPGEPAVVRREIEEVAHGVAVFVEGRNASVCLESDGLLMWTSRALASLGRQQLARRFLLFRTGVARFSEWSVAPGEKVLVLDLSRLDLRNADCCELILFRALAVILEAAADAWDESQGRGVLGLRGVGAVSAALAGRPGRGRRASALAGEVLRGCELRLRLMARNRGWTESPRVMNLDA
jgi:hypothetical protein